MIRSRDHLMLTCGLAALAGLAGCSDPRAVAPTRTRLERIDLHLTQLRDREADGTRRLAVMSELIERESRWHDEHFARDVRRVGDWARHDVKRWHERQPVYRARVTDAVDGDVKNANDTIPLMFY